MEVSAVSCRCGKIFKTIGGLKSHITQSYYCKNRVQLCICCEQPKPLGDYYGSSYCISCSSNKNIYCDKCLKMKEEGESN